MVQTLKRAEAHEEARRAEYIRFRKALEAKILPLILRAEQRHAYLTSHQAGVAWIASAIAREMGFDELGVDGVRFGASVHDVGMAEVPAHIINKPGSLTGEEKGLVERHCAIGAKLLEKIESPWPLARIAIEHQERMDGSGYPKRLTGKEIIIEARIIAVADAIEAMSMDRAHREIPGIDKALGHLAKQMGRAFDREVVRAALAVFADRRKAA